MSHGSNQRGKRLAQIYRAVSTLPRIFFINGLRISTIVVDVNVFLLFLFFGLFAKYAGYVRSHHKITGEAYKQPGKIRIFAGY